MSKEVEIEIDSSRFRPFDVDNLVCNYDRANRLLGWKPEVSIKSGLESTINWIKENGLNINTPYHHQYELE
jgi:nucleoside-diphosphate-sugar epimerase